MFVPLLVLLGQLAALPAVSERTWARPDHFWWRRSVAAGNIWLTVDARHGAKTPLFDHQRLAIELNLRTGYDFTPTTLPFADPAARFTVKYDGSNAYIQEGAMAIEFVLDGMQWRCELQIKWDWNKVPPTDYECLPRRRAEPAGSIGSTGSIGSASPDGTVEAIIIDHNVAIRPAGGGAVRMLTTDGKEGDAYDPGSLRWSKDSRTVSAYRLNAAIWNSDGVSGNVKPLITFRELKIGR
jgi:hypothetical protein